MVEQAIKKLQDEIAKNKDNQAIKAVGNFLIVHVQNHSEDAEKIMTEKKTVVGAMEYMKEKARKKQRNGYAVITPDEGIKIVMDYFGVKGVLGNAKVMPTLAESVIKPKETVPKQAEAKFDINLDDLL